MGVRPAGSPGNVGEIQAKVGDGGARPLNLKLDRRPANSKRNSNGEGEQDGQNRLEAGGRARGEE